MWMNFLTLQPRVWPFSVEMDTFSWPCPLQKQRGKFCSDTNTSTPYMKHWSPACLSLSPRSKTRTQKMMRGYFLKQSSTFSFVFYLFLSHEEEEVQQQSPSLFFARREQDFTQYAAATYVSLNQTLILTSLHCEFGYKRALLSVGKASVSVTSSRISVRLGANPLIMNTLALVRNTVTHCSIFKFVSVGSSGYKIDFGAPANSVIKSEMRFWYQLLCLVNSWKL